MTISQSDAVAEYHNERIPFVIIPGVALIVGHKGCDDSHKDLLLKIGIPQQLMSHMLDNYPRGYYLDNNLVIYQKENVIENDAWKLHPDNYKVVADAFSDLKKLFPFDAQTRIFLGVLRGKPNTLWDKIEEVPQSFFDEYSFGH